MEHFGKLEALDQSKVLMETYRLAEYILHSSLVENYVATREQMYQDPEALSSISAFKDLKEKYEEVQRIGKYHPDYKTVVSQVREAKKNLAKIPTVLAFQAAEEELDDVLYQVGRIVANGVSPRIKVLSNNPLQSAGAGCGSGGCGTGGCGCHS